MMKNNMEKVDIIQLDLRQHNAPCSIAEALLRTDVNRSVEIVIADVDLCPNRIVPVVGIADDFVSKGRDVRFKVLPHSAGERALEGFITRRLNPSVGLDGRYEVPGPAFGRVWRFDNGAEQGALVNAMVLELDKAANLAKGVKQCFEWCLNEVTDNVLNHSSPQGGAHGYVMVQFVPNENRLKVCVFDAGIGLKQSFVGSQHNPKDAADAIRMAIGKGITNGKGQGNGLWGLHEMVKIGKRGKLHIRSDGAEYLFDPAASIESQRPSWSLVGFPGTTIVDFQMSCLETTRLQDIFGEDYDPVDLWRENREQADGSLLLKVRELASGYGSRESAREVRHVVENAIDNDRAFVVLDFDGVETCSSSFIDELLVKLVAKYGAVTYPNSFKVVNLTGLTAGLANFSAAQRLGGAVSQIAYHVRGNPRTTIKKISEALNRSENETRGIIKKLREYGILLREGAKKNGIWRIADWVNDEVLEVEDRELVPVRINEDGEAEIFVEMDLADEPELCAKLDKLSRETGKSVDELIREAVKRVFAKHPSRIVSGSEGLS